MDSITNDTLNCQKKKKLRILKNKMNRIKLIRDLTRVV